MNTGRSVAPEAVYRAQSVREAIALPSYGAPGTDFKSALFLTFQSVDTTLTFQAGKPQLLG
jgi:hypothetical protein